MSLELKQQEIINDETDVNQIVRIIKEILPECSLDFSNYGGSSEVISYIISNNLVENYNQKKSIVEFLFNEKIKKDWKESFFLLLKTKNLLQGLLGKEIEIIPPGKRYELEIKKAIYYSVIAFVAGQNILNNNFIETSTLKNLIEKTLNVLQNNNLKDYFSNINVFKPSLERKIIEKKYNLTKKEIFSNPSQVKNYAAKEKLIFYIKKIRKFFDKNVTRENLALRKKSLSP